MPNETRHSRNLSFFDWPGVRPHLYNDLMEKLFYELKPFLCVYLGATAVKTPAMWTIGLLPAFVLVGCGLVMLAARYQHRLVDGELPPPKWDGKVERAERLHARYDD